MDRLLAICGLLAGMGALVVTLHGSHASWRGDRVTSATAVTHAPGAAADLVAPAEPAGRTQVWQQVCEDLRLDAEQARELAQFLTACEQGLQEARRHPDALWRDRLARRARRDAYDLTSAILTREQFADFGVWLDAPTHRDLATWFQRPEGCRGCGGKK
jgi:hypothetical protein